MREPHNGYGNFSITVPASPPVRPGNLERARNRGAALPAVTCDSGKSMRADFNTVQASTIPVMPERELNPQPQEILNVMNKDIKTVRPGLVLGLMTLLFGFSSHAGAQGELQGVTT